MFMLNDVTEYTVGKCHELQMREVSAFWKHVGIWTNVKNGRKKAK